MTQMMIDLMKLKEMAKKVHHEIEKPGDTCTCGADEYNNKVISLVNGIVREMQDILRPKLVNIATSNFMTDIE